MMGVEHDRDLEDSADEDAVPADDSETLQLASRKSNYESEVATQARKSEHFMQERSTNATHDSFTSKALLKQSEKDESMTTRHGSQQQSKKGQVR